MAEVCSPLNCAGITECRGSHGIYHSQYKCWRYVRDCLHRLCFSGALRAPRGRMGLGLPCETSQRIPTLSAATSYAPAALWCMSYENKGENWFSKAKLP